jgi:hypothetical protein
MLSSPSSPEQEFLDRMTEERMRELQEYFDREVRTRAFEIFLRINSDMSAAAMGAETSDEKLQQLLSHGGLWKEIDPLLKIDRLRLFRNAIEKFSESLKSSNLGETT